MTLDRAHRLSVVGYFLLLAVVVASCVAVARHGGGPVVRHATPCYFPPEVEDGPAEMVPLVPATTRVQVVARLREIRRKAAELAPPGLDLDSPPEPGTFAELDALVRDLISDLDSPGETRP